MTKKESKELSLEVWRYFEAHPEVKRNKQLPYHSYKRVRGLRAESPLCEVIFNVESGCSGCPLRAGGSYCYFLEHPYDRWASATNEQDRKMAAGEIVGLIEAWEV
jgi:hypothetical protein